MVSAGLEIMKMEEEEEMDDVDLRGPRVRWRMSAIKIAVFVFFPIVGEGRAAGNATTGTDNAYLMNVRPM